MNRFKRARQQLNQAFQRLLLHNWGLKALAFIITFALVYFAHINY